MPSSWLNVGSNGLSMVVKVGLLPANADALSMIAAITMGANFIRNIIFSWGAPVLGLVVRRIPGRRDGFLAHALKVWLRKAFPHS
ncbi:MAG TPA: hypothetical protein VKB49_04550 [Candidatus Sulfotelmatobacter sp.]|nr:hypothetical protein [Candidatus Sulfotelmatobacter sp.]